METSAANSNNIELAFKKLIQGILHQFLFFYIGIYINMIKNNMEMDNNTRISKGQKVKILESVNIESKGCCGGK